MPLAPRRLSTQRLLLRPPQMADAQDLFSRYAGRAEIVEPFSFDVHENLQDTRNFIQHCQQQWDNPEGPFEWAIQYQDQGVIGMISFRPRAKISMLGYILGPDFWGQGFTTEAGRAVRDVAFLEARLPYFRAFHFPGNQASGRVLEKMGLTSLGRFPAREVPRLSNHRSQEAVVYQMTAREWVSHQRKQISQFGADRISWAPPQPL